MYLPIASLLAVLPMSWYGDGRGGQGGRGGRGNVTKILLLRTSFSPPDARHLLGS